MRREVSRKLYLSVTGIILSTTIVGLILIPLAVAVTPVVLIRPSIMSPLYNRAQDKFMKAGTQMVMKGIKVGRTARI